MMVALQNITLSSLLLLTLSGAVRVTVDLTGSPKAITKLQVCEERGFGYVKDISISLDADGKPAEYEFESIEKFVGIKCFVTANPKEVPVVVFKDMKGNMTKIDGNDGFIMTPFIIAKL